MDPETAILETEDAMEKAVEYLLHEFATVRTGKASPGLIENIDVHIHSYGSVMKLKQLAVISAPEARLLEVKVFDPSTTQDVERAIRESRLGLNPAAAGSSLRVPIPELSEERRVQMVKLVKQLAEEAKVRVRAVRKEGMDAAKKMKTDNLLTEDGQKDHEAEVQKLTDKYIKAIDEHVVAKEKEVMKV
ncbi:ribosome recycling factor [Luteolibacter luteus]|uniref:Ribosome-recycling factor n=1 Tax=Luteolibacter luteus TaxID=2728835 RepID=A0A858RN52_9BACT|nr:ribosome recycling factor [Luteolibacter luteus]QJE97590.1 ribosome recycling factor [Luteolibacter luteus]